MTRQSRGSAIHCHLQRLRPERRGVLFPRRDDLLVDSLGQPRRGEHSRRRAEAEKPGPQRVVVRHAQTQDDAATFSFDDLLGAVPLAFANVLSGARVEGDLDQLRAAGEGTQ